MCDGKLDQLYEPPARLLGIRRSASRRNVLCAVSSCAGKGVVETLRFNRRRSNRRRRGSPCGSLRRGAMALVWVRYVYSGGVMWEGVSFWQRWIVLFVVLCLR